MTQVDEGKTIQLLEERTSRLEAKLIGPLSREEEYPEVIPILSSLGSKLGNALSTRDRMMMVMKRLDELERYLDPSYGETCEVTDPMKVDMILSQEDQIRSYQDSLNSLHSKKKVLDSQEIANATNMSLDLIKLSKKHEEIDGEAKNQSAEITSLLDKYNSIICTLTETLVSMDNTVSKAEQKATKKPVTDD